MTLISGLIGVIGLLVSLVLWLFGKKSTAEALLKNSDVTNQVGQINGQIAKNQGLIDASKEELAKKESEDASKETILDTINRLNNR